MDEKDEFAEKWLSTKVKLKSGNVFTELKDVIYYVTSALLDYEEKNGEKMTIFALLDIDYDVDTNRNFITLRLTREWVNKLEDSFEIICKDEESEKELLKLIHTKVLVPNLINI
jgi:hypothetical protein